MNSETEHHDKQDKGPAKSSKQVNPWLGWTRDIIVLVVFVFGFRAVVAEANWIPTSSMVPTLEVNDKIIVDKIGLHFSDVHRGDIVIFFPPSGRMSEQEQGKVRFIKRVIGLPGETLEVRSGDGVYVDGQKLFEPYVHYYPDASSTPNYNWGPMSLGADEYFLLGDNRRESKDSHVWGPCPRENIIGRAMFRYWPVLRIGAIEDNEFKGDYFSAG